MGVRGLYIHIYTHTYILNILYIFALHSCVTREIDLGVFACASVGANV